MHSLSGATSGSRVAQIRCWESPRSVAGNRPWEAMPWGCAMGVAEHSSWAGCRLPSLQRAAQGCARPSRSSQTGGGGRRQTNPRILAEAIGALGLGPRGSTVEEPPGGGADSLLLGRVGAPSWKKGFPGAEVGKANRSWPGEEGLEEYSRKGGN